MTNFSHTNFYLTGRHWFFSPISLVHKKRQIAVPSFWNNRSYYEFIFMQCNRYFTWRSVKTWTSFSKRLFFQKMNTWNKTYLRIIILFIKSFRIFLSFSPRLRFCCYATVTSYILYITNAICIHCCFVA